MAISRGSRRKNSSRPKTTRWISFSTRTKACCRLWGGSRWKIGNARRKKQAIFTPSILRPTTTSALTTNQKERLKSRRTKANKSKTGPKWMQTSKMPSSVTRSFSMKLIQSSPKPYLATFKSKFKTQSLGLIRACILNRAVFDDKNKDNGSIFIVKYLQNSLKMRCSKKTELFSDVISIAAKYFGLPEHFVFVSDS